MNRSLVAYCCILILPLAAAAEQGGMPLRATGPYVGASLGFATVEIDQSPATLDGDSFGYNLLAGYRFRPQWLPLDAELAVEGRYLDLGEPDDNAFGSSIEAEVDALQFYGIGLVPVSERFDAFAEIGLVAWDADLSVDGSSIDDDDGTDLAVGIGLAYNTGSRFGARVELEGMDFLDGVWFLSISGIYQFK